MANGFGGYVALSDWLAERGFEIGKSTVAVHGKDLKRQLDAVRAATLTATAITEAASDDPAALSNAIYTQLQTGMLEALTTFFQAEDETNPAEKLLLLTKAGKDFAALARGNLAGKRHLREMRETLVREQQAKLDGLAKSGAISPEVLERVRVEVYGIHG